MADLPQGCRRGVDEIRLLLSSWEDSGFSRVRSCLSQPRLLAEQRGGAWCGEHRMRDMYSSLQGQGLRALPSEVMPSQLGSAPPRCFGVSVAPILPGVVLGGLGGLCCLEEPPGRGRCLSLGRGHPSRGRPCFQGRGFGHSDHGGASGSATAAGRARVELWLPDPGHRSRVAAGLPHLPAGQQGAASRGRLPGLAPRERGLPGPRGIPELAGSQTCRERQSAVSTLQALGGWLRG